MNIVLLKSKNPKTSVEAQQKHIFRYANQNSFIIDSTEIDNSSLDEPLKERKELKGFLRSLNDNDNIFIYDFLTFSIKIDELVKIFDCLFTHSVKTHITSLNLIIEKEMRSAEIFSILSKLSDERFDIKKTPTQGRPKGRMSKSKFDVFRLQIINLLEENRSVNEIAKILNVSRSSLKDYINSRGLKELVKEKSKLLDKKDFKNVKITPDKECNLIKQTKQRKDDVVRY